MMVDEADDIDLVGGSSSQSGGHGAKRPSESPNPIPVRPSKRKAGPLPRDFFFRRPFSPLSLASPSPQPSPIPMLLGDMEIRPDSPLPNVNSPMFSSPTVGRVDSEDESDSLLVIADYSIDPPAETSLLNGTSKCTLTEDPPGGNIVMPSPLQTLTENGTILRLIQKSKPLKTR
jgi:integrator complex subunit 6